MFRKALYLFMLTVVYVKGQNKDLRLLLLGKTGAGKSTTGNSILGRQQFPAKISAQSVTKETEMASVIRFGRKLTVVDTPGFFDTKKCHDDVILEIGKFHAMTSPGPHAILLVMEIGPRCTEQENKSLKMFIDYFGEQVYNHVIVVFTRQKADTENIDIEDFIKKEIEDSSLLKSFLRRISNRFIALGRDVQETEIKNLLNLVDTVVYQNNGRYYTNEMYQAAAKRLHDRQTEEKRKLQEKRGKEIADKKREKEENHQKEMLKIQQKMKDEEIEFKLKKLKGPRYQVNCYVGSSCTRNAYLTYHYDGVDIPLCCQKDKPKMHMSDDGCHCKTGKDESSEVIVSGKLTL